jgi:hypothetical protein
MNGQGWVPVDFTGITQGVPFGALPADPVNTSSSRDYYTYTTDGTHYEVTAVMESAKYQLGGSNDVISGDGGTLASVYEKGSKLGLEPLDYGDPTLVGLWTFDEGSGSVAYDYSGSNATGSWQGGSSYTAGKVGAYAGQFNGADYVKVPSEPSLNTITISAWVQFQGPGSGYARIVQWGSSNGGKFNVAVNPSGILYTDSNPGWRSTGQSLDANFDSIVASYDGTTLRAYWNGNAVYVASSGVTLNSGPISIGGPGISEYFPGLIDDVRIYNRALSAAQIAAMYAGGK